jgi:uncharacterized protein YjbI with pentapeptide repeats
MTGEQAIIQYNKDKCLRAVNLCGADLRWADLRGANLYRADLRWADLCRANLREADLRGANLYRADLCGADLCGASLWNCIDGPLCIHGSKHTLIFIPPHSIAIGCVTRTITEWLTEYIEIGHKWNYSEAQIAEYGLYIELFKKRYNV